MKNMIMSKITAIVLLLTVIALMIISGTYAKYTSSKEQQSTTTVAKWNIQMFEGTSTQETQTFNLFKNIKDLDGQANDSNLNGVNLLEENDVKPNRIAPGTGGKLELQVKNNSEVTAKCTFSITKIEMTKQIPIKISADGKNWISITTVQEELEKTKELEKPTAYNLGDAIELAAGNTDTKSHLYWRWDFEREKNADTEDTAIAQGDVAECKITIKMNAEQVD